MRSSKLVYEAALAAAVAAVCAGPALGHHGFGRFAVNEDAQWTGTLTEIDLVNPHSYVYFESEGPDGQPISMHCEMRAATLIRRSGWSTDMFVPGSRIMIEGHPHRDDPSACYVENFKIGDAPTINRNEQFEISQVDTSDRDYRLPSGEPDISGDWAVEQLVLTVPPDGGRGALVPRGLRDAYAAGEITLQEIRARNPGSSRPDHTEAGQEAADAFRMWSVEDNPRLSCQPTSIIYDWTFDWPVNRVNQHTTEDGEKVIAMDYGLYSFTRRIHMGMESHPEDLEPSYAGHSIGHWEDDTLVVDTVGFEAGVLSPPTLSSEQMHVVERFTLDSEDFSLTRKYTVEDPVYLASPYEGQDTVHLSATAFERHPCEELTPEF